MSARSRLALVLVLALVGGVLSGLLLQQHHGAGAAAQALCGEEGSGCDVVNRSRWSELAGVPVAALGFAFYGSLAALALLGLLGDAERRTGLAALALVAVGAALLVDVALLGVQAFAIGSFCVLCLVTYALNAAALVALLPERRAVGSLVRLPAEAPGRLALGGWGAATVAAALAAAALSLAFETRGELREATLLGAPLLPAGSATPAETAPAASAAETPEAPADTPQGEPAPVAAAAEAPPAPATGDADVAAELERARQETAAARAEVGRLQAILDDPQKYEQYRSDVSMAAYEKAPVEAIALGQTPFKGPTDAPVKVVEYSDFMCPYCRSLAGAFQGYLPQSGGRVAIYFKNYPLDPACNAAVQGGHPGACNLAMGGICAHRQGHFWEYHDRVFSAEHHQASPSDVAAIAAGAGLDRAAFEQCLAAPETRKQLESDVAEGSRLGVHGTPTVYVNGRRLPRINDFVRVVASELERLGLPAPPGTP